MFTALILEVSVDKAGYEWAPVPDQRCVDNHEPLPIWRVSPPWTAKDTPRILLRAIRTQGQRNIDLKFYGPALYRDFAAMEPTPDNIAAFACEYGNLIDRYPDGQPLLSGLPLSEWLYEIGTMRFLIEVWDAVCSGRKSSLKFPRDYAGRYLYPHVNTLLGYHRYLMAPKMRRAKAVKDKSLLQVARKLIHDAINERLNCTGSQMEITETDEPLQLAMRPNDLLGALWIQFAESFCEVKEHRRCKDCGCLLLFVERADQRYCSDACRSQAYRNRKKRAKKLKVAGYSLKEISKITGSDVDKLKKWLQPTRE